MRFNKRSTLIVPADMVDEVNEIFLRHGYGPNNVSAGAVDLSAAKDAKPSHFTLEMPADSGIAALVANVINSPGRKSRGLVARVTDRNDRVLGSEMFKLNLKAADPSAGVVNERT